MVGGLVFFFPHCSRSDSLISEDVNWRRGTRNLGIFSTPFPSGSLQIQPRSLRESALQSFVCDLFGDRCILASQGGHLSPYKTCKFLVFSHRQVVIIAK